jgi:cytochrome c oxidase assembly protein Cox11
MPVFFFIDPEILEDKSMDTTDIITLSYTFFKTDEEEPEAAVSSASALAAGSGAETAGGATGKS